MERVGHLSLRYPAALVETACKPPAAPTPLLLACSSTTTSLKALFSFSVLSFMVSHRVLYGSIAGCLDTNKKQIIESVGKPRDKFIKPN
jgi:hypothetical protein